MSDETISDEVLIELRLVVAGTPGLLAVRIAHLPHLGVVRVVDERGPWVDLDECVFASGERHHWETYARARLGELAERMLS